jgi:hypothetical protein
MMTAVTASCMVMINVNTDPQLAISVYTMFKVAIQSGLAFIQQLMRVPHGLSKNKHLALF